MAPSSPPNRPPNPGRRNDGGQRRQTGSRPNAATSKKAGAGDQSAANGGATPASEGAAPAIVDDDGDQRPAPGDGSDPVTENGQSAAGARRAGWSSDTPGVPWARMFFIGVVCFAVWLLLDAPSLQRSAQVAPLGTRRTVSLDFVGPIAALSRGLGLSHVVGWTDELFGRTPGGGPTLAAVAPSPVARHGTVGPFLGTHGHPIVTTPAGPTTTTTTTLPALDTHPTGADPLKVLVVGDSVGLDLGQALVADLSNTGVVSPVLDGRVDTGLSRPDYFDWPAELRIDIINQHPSLVVVMIGANDPQSIVGGAAPVQYGASGWVADYGQRVGAFIDEANNDGAHVLWVGMPPMANPLLNAELQQINSIVQTQVVDRPGKATYLSSVPVLGGPKGQFTAYLTSPSGAAINVRTTDGIHLSPGGAEVLSQAVIASMRSNLHIDLP